MGRKVICSDFVLLSFLRCRARGSYCSRPRMLHQNFAVWRGCLAGCLIVACLFGRHVRPDHITLVNYPVHVTCKMFPPPLVKNYVCSVVSVSPSPATSLPGPRARHLSPLYFLLAMICLKTKHVFPTHAPTLGPTFLESCLLLLWTVFAFFVAFRAASAG